MPNKRTIPRVCRQCRADFLADPGNVRKGGGWFCSLRCARLAQAAQNNPAVMLTCETCGTEKRVKAYKATTARFCSRACQGGPSTKHGDARDGHRAPEYDVWRAMLDRCQNPSNPFYTAYGARGITVCPAWREYTAFIRDMGYRPSAELTLDRVNNDLGYFPGNVEWRTRSEQQRNKHDNVWLTVGGVRRLRIEWAELIGLSVGGLKWRLSAGWTPEQAVGIEPPPSRSRKHV